MGADELEDTKLTRNDKILVLVMLILPSIILYNLYADRCMEYISEFFK